MVNSSLSTSKCCNNRKTVNVASPIELKSEIQPFSHSGFSDFINRSALIYNGNSTGIKIIVAISFMLYSAISSEHQNTKNHLSTFLLKCE